MQTPCRIGVASYTESKKRLVQDVEAKTDESSTKPSNVLLLAPDA